MAGLLAKLARGLGAGMESFGTSMLEQKRTDRLEKMKLASEGRAKEFRTTEREAGQKFQAGQQTERLTAQKNREALKQPSPKLTNIKDEADDFGDPTGGKTWVQDGKFMRQDFPGGPKYEEGKPPKGYTPGPKLTEEQLAEKDVESTKSAEKWADKHSKYFSLDSTDFEVFQNSEDRTEEKVTSIYKKMRSMAEAKGEEALKRFNREATPDAIGLKWLATMWDRMQGHGPKTYSGKITHQ